MTSRASWGGILASTCDEKFVGPEATLALFTLSGDFAPHGAGIETRLVEFADDPGP
jgi:hypothetical protein